VKVHSNHLQQIILALKPHLEQAT